MISNNQTKILSISKKYFDSIFNASLQDHESYLAGTNWKQVLIFL